MAPTEPSDSSRPIGVFDSGLGGLTVVRALSSRLPNERLIYLGDTARVPYGTKSAATVIRYAEQIADFLVAKGIKYLVVACNTASAHALVALRSHVPVPVLGVVDPGASVAAAHAPHGRVGVIGTLGTVSSGAYQRAIQRLRPEVIVFSKACPLLVPLAEEGWTEHPVTSQVIEHYLRELQADAADLDTLVLGCTHYPLLAEAIAAAAARVFAHPITLVDSAEAAAEAAAADLAGRQIAAETRSGADTFFFTDDSRFAELAPRFLGRIAPKAERADLR